ncbi:MAG: GatB/YqeY domain-containing protein [Minisyncoccota bacterium]
MSIQTDIKAQMMEAMKAKDAVKLQTIRGLVSAFTNELVNLKRTPQDSLSDEEALAVIKRAVKQRKDSIEQFISGGRPELADDEKAELAILEVYLPVMMSEEEVMKIALLKKEEMGGIDKSKSGQFVGMIMKELKGKADGDVVKKVVDNLFS